MHESLGISPQQSLRFKILFSSALVGGLKVGGKTFPIALLTLCGICMASNGALLLLRMAQTFN